jgi:hypothetical protein
MKPIKIKLDEDGVVENPFIQSSSLVGINISGEFGAQNLELDFISESGKNFRAHLSGVQFLFCNEFRSQNVVENFWVHTETDCEEVLRAEQEYLGIKESDMDSILGDIEDGSLLLFQLEPSIGTAIACICEAFSLSGE